MPRGLEPPGRLLETQNNPLQQMDMTLPPPETVLAMIAKFIEFLEEVGIRAIKELTGVDLSELSDLLGTIAAGLASAATTAALAVVSALVSSLGAAVQFLKDLLTGITDALDVDVTDWVNGIKSGINGAVANITGIWNGIVNALTGIGGNAWGQSDANDHLAAQAATVAQVAASVALLQQASDPAASGGSSAFVDFSIYPDGPTMPAPFSQTYSLTGIATLGMNGGKAAWFGNNPVGGISSSADRLCDFRYNVKETLTDTQKISAVFASAPGWINIQPPFPPGTDWRYAYNYIRGRKNAAGTSYVEAAFGGGRVYLSCMVAGMATAFNDAPHTFQPGAIYALECGTAGGARIFRVTCNGIAILTFPEVGATSQLGALYRWTGGGGFANLEYEWAPLSVPRYALPGQLSAFAMADNVLPTYLGKQARWYRAAAAGVAGTGMTADNLLDTTDYNTSGVYTFSGGSNCRVTVSERGVYEITWHYGLPGAGDSTAVVWVNGVILKRIGRGLGEVNATALLNLSAGDYINVGTLAAATIVGDAPGSLTYLEIRKVE